LFGSMTKTLRAVSLILARLMKRSVSLASYQVLFDIKRQLPVLWEITASGTEDPATGLLGPSR
jgi:hypothetical protein